MRRDQRLKGAETLVNTDQLLADNDKIFKSYNKY